MIVQTLVRKRRYLRSEHSGQTPRRRHKGDSGGRCLWVSRRLYRPVQPMSQDKGFSRMYAAQDKPRHAAYGSRPPLVKALVFRSPRCLGSPQAFMSDVAGYCSLTIVTIILSVIFSLPVFASSSLSILQSYPSSLTTESILADSSLAIIRQKQSLNLFQQLNLTAEQQRQIKAIHSQYRQQIRRKKDTIAKLQRQLSDMMVGTEPVELLRAKNQQLNNLRQEIGTLRFESMLATREILTPQQREKFRDLVHARLADD